MPNPKGKYKSFAEHFGDGQFYPDLPKIDFKELLDRELVLHECKILANFKGKFGTHDAALMLLSEVKTEKERFTTICSGEVVVDRIKQVLETPVELPMLCTPVSVAGAEGDNPYYNLL